MPPVTLHSRGILPASLISMFDISWSASVDYVVGYYVNHGTEPGPPYANQLDVGNVLGTTYAALGWTSGTTHYYSVQSYDDSRIPGAFGTEIAVTVP